MLRRKGEGSLASRLVRVAALWSVLALGLAGFVLVGLYQQAGERAFDALLDQHAKILLASLLPEPDVPAAAAPAPTAGPAIAGQGPVALEPAALRLQAPGALGEPRFSLPLSGWYWSVRSTDGSVLFSSSSLVGDALSLPAVPEGETSLSGFALGPGGEEVRYLRRQLDIGLASYVISVAIETGGFRSDVRDFAGMVGATLAVLGIGLVGAIFWQVRFGLRPLTRLQHSLAEVREGLMDGVDEDMPRELAPLAGELNALIRSNREVVERARTHVGNLAHALKTPLSVLINEARSAEGPLARKVEEQTSHMQTQVQHHLERARLAAQRRVIGVACDVEPLVERLVRAMGRIYRDRDVELDWQAPAGLRFRGEAQDLEEMTGNLLDNACKWARLQVRVQVRQLAADRSGRSFLELLIEDDGPGLSPDQRREAVQRGKRLDETVPGTGLGLAIVVDLAGLYGGEVALSDSDLGGLAVRLTLPAADERLVS
nr:ATP-binding protein [Roseibium aestuarii]